MTEREGVIVPPINFALVLPGVYRSGCPTKENIGFLKRLNLRCLLYIGTETLPQDYLRLSQENIVQETMVIGMEGNKEPFVTMSYQDVTNVLAVILDKSYHPILLHSMKGRHRQGVVVGCLRKLQGLSLVSIFDEYDRYCGRYKAQPIDKRYIETFHPSRKFKRSALPEEWLHDFALQTYFETEEDGKRRRRKGQETIGSEKSGVEWWGAGEGEEEEGSKRPILKKCLNCPKVGASKKDDIFFFYQSYPHSINYVIVTNKLFRRFLFFL